MVIQVSKSILCPTDITIGFFTLSFGLKPAPQTFPDSPISFAASPPLEKY